MGGGGNMGGHMGGGGGGGYQGQMGNGMGPSMGGGGGGGMQLDQANLNNLMGTLLSNLERNIIQRQTMGGAGGVGYRDRLPSHRGIDRDRRDRGPLRGVAKGDRGGIRRDRFQPKFNNRDRDAHKKPQANRDFKTKAKTDKEKRATDSKKRDSVKKDDEKKEKKEEEKKEEVAEAKKDGAEKAETSKASEGEAKAKTKDTEAYCTVCEKFFTGDLVDHRRSTSHKEEKQRKFPSGQRRCDICKISFFRTQQALWNHLRSSMHKMNTTQAVKSKKEDKANGELVTVDTVGYSDDEDGNKKARGSSKRSTSDGDEKEAKKSKLEHSKEVLDSLAAIPKDDPNPVVAMDHVVPMTGYYCKVCHKFYHNEVMAKVTHCRSKPHCAKYEEGIKNGTIKAPATAAEEKAEKADADKEEKREEESKEEEKAEEEVEKGERKEESSEEKAEEEAQEEKEEPMEESQAKEGDEEERPEEAGENEETPATEAETEEPETEQQNEGDAETVEGEQEEEEEVEEEKEEEETKEASPSSEAPPKEEDVLVIGNEDSGDVESGAETGTGGEETPAPDSQEEEEEEEKPAGKKNVAKRGGKAGRGRKKAAN